MRYSNDGPNDNISSSSSPQDFNVHRSDCPEGKVIEKIAKSRKLGEIASDILGVDSVRLYQTCTFFKAVGQGETSWHADLATAPFDTNNVCSGQSDRLASMRKRFLCVRYGPGIIKN